MLEIFLSIVNAAGPSSKLAFAASGTVTNISARYLSFIRFYLETGARAPMLYSLPRESSCRFESPFLRYIWHCEETLDRNISASLINDILAVYLLRETRKFA